MRKSLPNHITDKYQCALSVGLTIKRALDASLVCVNLFSDADVSIQYGNEKQALLGKKIETARAEIWEILLKLNAELDDGNSYGEDL